MIVIVLMIRRPPRSSLPYTCVPYTTCFRFRLVESLLEFVGARRGDLRERQPLGSRQRSVLPPLDPARAQYQRLQFLGGEHQRRQEEAGAQHIADPRRTLDRRAQGDQRRDVAIEIGSAEGRGRVGQYV